MRFGLCRGSMNADEAEERTSVPGDKGAATSPRPEPDKQESGQEPSTYADAATIQKELADNAAQELKECRRRGKEALEKGRSAEAVEHYTKALQQFQGAGGASLQPDVKASVYRERSEAFASISKEYRSRPASRSEYSALYGLDPMHLAQLALADAVKAVELTPNCALNYAQKGLALFLLERYPEAEEAYLAGLGVDPSAAPLQEGLKEVKALLSENQGVMKRQRSLDRQVDDFECTLCMKLLFEPVTTPCGHTFCRGCYARAMDHGTKCPMCRTVLHCGRQLPLSITLVNIISKSFAAEYEERRREEREEANAGAAASSAETGQSGDGTTMLPLFVMSVVLPGEKMSLNVFEPRYRLMVRRAMEGNRRFGMAQVGSGRNIEEILTEAEIIECNPLPDGRYHLDIIGVRRVRLVSTSELDGYRIGCVQPFADAEEPQGEAAEDPPLSSLALEMAQVADSLLAQLRVMSGSNPAAAGRLRQLLSNMGQRPSDADLEAARPEQVEKLSFWMASLLLNVSPSLHDHNRMDLLRIASSRQRLMWLKEHAGGGVIQGGRCSIM